METIANLKSTFNDIYIDGGRTGHVFGIAEEIGYVLLGLISGQFLFFGVDMMDKRHLTLDNLRNECKVKFGKW